MSAALWSRSSPSLLSTLLQLRNNTLPARQHKIHRTVYCDRTENDNTHSSRIYISEYLFVYYIWYFKRVVNYLNCFIENRPKSLMLTKTGAGWFGSKIPKKNMPLKPRPLKRLLLCSSTQWHKQSLRSFSHLPSFIRITARSCCMLGSSNIWASVSLVLITCRYNSTIFLCVHLKVEIKPGILKSH